MGKDDNPGLVLVHSSEDAFPLDQWFDVTQRISRDDREMCEAQMQLYALKDGDDPCGPEANKAISQLRAAVKAHNAKFPPRKHINQPPNPNSRRARWKREKAAREARTHRQE